MHRHHNKTEIEISSFSLRRRDVLAGATAIVVSGGPSIAAPIAPSDNYDEMMMLADQREELAAQSAELHAQLDELKHRPDRPALPEVNAVNVLGQDHWREFYPWSSSPWFRGVAEIDKWFAVQIQYAENRARANREWEHWPQIRREDHRKVVAALERMIDSSARWNKAVGLTSIANRCNAVILEWTTVQDRALALPCLSARDIGAKLEMMDRWFADADGGVSYDEDLRTILNSMRGLAASEPDRRTGAVRVAG